MSRVLIFNYQSLCPLVLLVTSNSNAKHNHVYFEKKEISALNSKNDKKNTIPMSNKLYETLLKMYKCKNNDKYVFTNPYTGTKYKDIKKVLKLFVN